MKGVVLLLLMAAGCNNGSPSPTKPPDAPTPTAETTASAATASPMLTDDALKQAVTQKQDVLIVKVKDLAQAGAGSRSELTTYTLDIVKSISGGATGSIKLSHYGAPQLAANKAYAITTRGGNPAWGTKGLKDSVEVMPGQEDALAEAYKKKIDALPK